MDKKVLFTSVKSTINNKELKQDDNGYYLVNLGAINVFNSAGAFYTSEGVVETFNDKNSSLSRRIKSRYLKGEAGHPDFEIGMTKYQYLNKNLKIDLTKTSHHIRDISLLETNLSSELAGYGKPIIIEGWIKPSGPYGDALKKSLDNKDENVAFSIRSLTADKKVNNITIKKLVQVITFDWVTEPGISTANKHKKLSVESIDICSLSLKEVFDDTGCVNGEYQCSIEGLKDNSIINETKISVETFENEPDILDEW